MPSIFKNTRFDPNRGADTSYPARTPVRNAVRAVAAPVGRAVAPVRRAASRVTSATNFALLAAWFGLGALSIFAPLLMRNRRMNQYRRYNYNYNYNYGNRNYRYSADGYDYNNCKWYQFNCQSFYADERANEGYSPSWYSGWGSNERQRERAAENGEVPASLRFVYIWQLLMFVAILAYGFYVVHKGRSRSGLIGMLLIWANMSFIGMWLLADGSISTQGAAIENGGFYGQFSVLVFMTNFWYTIFGVIFTIVFAFCCGAARFMDQEPARQELATAKNVGQTPADYQAYQEPTPARAAPTPAPTPASTAPAAQKLDDPAGKLLDSDEEFVRVV